MPVLTNPKWEIFAQELAKGSSQLEAYVAAGYKPDDGHANRLAGYGRITARIAELQGVVAEHTEVTIEGLILEADEVQRIAVKERQLGAAIAALTAKAKLAGLWVERSENTHRYKNDAADWSRDELVTIINDALAGGEGTAPPQGRGEQPDPLH